MAAVSCLEDCDLIRLLNLMERARECISDGVSFEDAGLVRSVADCHMDSSIVVAPTRGETRQADAAETTIARLQVERDVSFPAAEDEPPF